MIILQCKLKPEDYIQAQYIHGRSRVWLKYFIITCFGLCFFSLFSSASSSISLTSVLITFAPAICLLSVLALVRFMIIPRNVRRIFSQQKTLQIEYEVMIFTDMIETKSELGTTRIRLSDFHKYKVGKDLILLYQSQVMFNIFPRRFFASEEDFRTFLSYLEANLGRPKR